MYNQWGATRYTVSQEPQCVRFRRVFPCFMVAYCSNQQNTKHFTQFRQLRLCRIAAMTKAGNMHCVIWI